MSTVLYPPIPLAGEFLMGRVQRCTVRFSNSHGVERSAEVEAASVFEAACRRWAKFKSSDETFDERSNIECRIGESRVNVIMDALAKRGRATFQRSK